MLAVVHTRESPCVCHRFFVREARALGWRTALVAVEVLFERRDVIARADLVAEHADTYRGRGDLRPLVRHAIEAMGGRLLGAGAAAAHLCDDKVAARARLERAGIPVPPPFRGRFPAVAKRPFEHGSRGVALVKTPEALAAVRRRWPGELLVEEYVDGRELAVGLVERGRRLQVLPIVETLVPFYGKSHKWGGPPGPHILAATLARRTERGIAALAKRAFRALGLRDYARFDLRLPSGGEPRFLEANARPSVEEGSEFRVAAELAGYDGRRLMELLLSRRESAG